MDTDTDNKKNSIWVGKTCILSLIKDKTPLTFTGTVLEVDNHSITFKDKFGETFQFPRHMFVEIKEKRGGY